MAKLVKAVYVKDPDRSRTVLLLPGEEPEPRLAVLITNPDAWEDGQLPDLGDNTAASADSDSDKDSDKSGDDKQATPAAKKTAPKRATSRSRGRDAAGEGTSGD